MPASENGGQYSSATGLVYVFNLIVGTGALALPSAFSQVGWIIGTIVVAILGVVSYITVTFIVETLAVVNAVNHHRSLNQRVVNSEETNDDEATPLFGGDSEAESFDIMAKYEITEMATVLLSKHSRVLVFVCLVLYLLGDLSIYTAVVGKTMSHVTCTHRPANISCNETLPDTVPCWDNWTFTRGSAYKTYACLFVLLLGPFALFNVQKTKAMQIVTGCMRSLAFGIMIVWSVQKLVAHGRGGNPVSVNIQGVPTLFGTCVYSFMCQHSIPGLVQPIADKRKLNTVLVVDYFIISFFYLLLSLTAIFTFPHIQDLYTLNFWSDTCNNQTSASYLFLDYYLALFPVFTLSTSFPIIAITLKNNLRNMFVSQDTALSWIAEACFPLVTVAVPLVLALTVSNLSLLVGVVGSYAGAGVQYLIPCILVTSARAHVSQLGLPLNPFTSMFSAKYWVIALYLWMTMSLVFITIKYVTDFI